MLLTLILTLTLSHYLTLSLFLTLTLFQSLIESLLTCWTTFVFISMLKSHSHTLTLSLSHTLSLSLSHSLNLSFNHSRHAEQVFFSCLGSKVAVYSRKLQCFFFDHSITLSCEFWVHRAGSQLKICTDDGRCHKQPIIDLRCEASILVQYLLLSTSVCKWFSGQCYSNSYVVSFTISSLV